MSGGRRRSGVALLGVFAVALALWAAMAVASIRQAPGWEGWLTGIFGGGFLALLVAGAGSWAVVLLQPGRQREPDAPMTFEPGDDLGAVLAELEAARVGIVKRVNARAVWRIPVCCVGAVGFWFWTQFSNDPADGEDIFAFLIAGALGGYGWAAGALGAGYRRMYKERVLPRLASRFGELSWRPAQPQLDDFERHRLFPEWDASAADDEIAGTYRGMPLSIVELTLTRGSGKNKRTVFRGLTAAVTLPRGLKGTTVVVPDRGMFGNLAERLRGGPCEPVRIEDPLFETAYEVYGSDQISARALLTPAFMERFLALAQSGRFGAPAALVQDNRLLMALHTTGGDLFEPPSYRQPAAGRAAVAQLLDDIRSVLKAADAVIDLDQAARRAPTA